MKLRSAVLLTLAFFAVGASAATFVVPTDRELVRAAKGIVIATAQSSYVRAGENGMIYTVYVMKTDEVIKGTVDPTFELVEPGGALDGRGVSVADSVVYRPGERALVFLDTTPHSEWRTWSMVLGKFNFVRDAHGVRLLMRGQNDDASVFGWDAAGNAHREVVRSEEKFLDFVRSESRGQKSDAVYTVDETQLSWPRKVRANVNGSGFHACDYAASASGACGAKWQSIFDQPGGGGSVAFVLVGTQAGVNGQSGVDAGMGAWNGDSLSNANLSDGGPGSAPYNPIDGTKSIHFDDSADTAQCGGAAVGCTFTGYTTGSPFTFDGGSFNPLIDADIAFKAGFTSNQTLFNEVATHELGHALGFRHSNQGTPSTSQSVMNSIAGGSFGASLQPWDHDAVSTMYNPAPAGSCTPPGVPVPSANPTSIQSGQSSQLSATASGTNPTFTWFTGSTPGTGTQIGTGASISVSPTTTTSYWVQATNACATGPVNSASSITVTVTAPPCTAPTQASATANPTTITTGASSQITVAANGTAPLTYQLMQGNPPSGTSVGSSTSSPILNTPALSNTTTFYVDVSNSCGRVSSNPVTITVQACSPPTTATATANPGSILTGTPTSLIVGSNGTGPLSYQWFTGNPPNGTAIPFANTQSISQSPSNTTTYYAQVSNSCGGPINSSPVTVTVTQSCTAPSNAVATATPGTINAGQTSNLAVTASGTGLTFQWFTGNPPNGTSIPGATSANVPVTPSATTTYFARVTGQCGTLDSNPVTVTVNVTPACIDPTITTHPSGAIVLSGTSAVLNVEAGGTAPLHYQWFEGPTGDTSKPRGTDSPAFNTGAISKKTQFWVQVRGNCTSDKRANSNTATVDVRAAKHPAVKH